jgi:hypothetical protein
MYLNLQDRLCFPEHVDEHGVVLEQQARRLVVIRLRGRVQSSFCNVNSIKSARNSAFFDIFFIYISTFLKL